MLAHRLECSCRSTNCKVDAERGKLASFGQAVLEVCDLPRATLKTILKKMILKIPYRKFLNIKAQLLSSYTIFSEHFVDN